MHRSARLAIAFVLALVVPWHAVAAATMVDCAPVPSHEHHAVTDATADAGHVMHHGHDDRGGTSAKVKCQSASSCCAAAALPSQPSAFDASIPSQRFAPAPLVGVAPFVTAGPERPPRTDRA